MNLESFVLPSCSYRGHGPRAVCLHGRANGKLGPLLRAVRSRLPRSGGWFAGCRMKTATRVEMEFELLVSSAGELYPMLLEAGVEMARTSHLQLTMLGNLSQHRATLPLGAVVEVRLEVDFDRSGLPRAAFGALAFA